MYESKKLILGVTETKWLW